MNINHYVIHEIKKERQGVANLISSNALPPITTQATNLLKALNEKYREKEIYGKFGNINSGTFPDFYNVYRTGPISASAFLTFTITAMNALTSQLANVNLATGGFFLFADYTFLNEDYLAIFLVRNTNGFLFQETNQQTNQQNASQQASHYYDIKDQIHIGLDKLAMACRINSSKFANRAAHDGNYLSFIRKASEASDYFINWISAIELKRSSAFTAALCDIIRNIELPAELEGYDTVDRDSFQKAVFDYCSNLPNNKIDLVDLSKKLYGEEQGTKILNKAEQMNLEISTEFTPDKQKLKRLYKINVVEGDINLKFDYKSYADGIVKINSNTTKVTIESPRLAAKIREEMEETLTDTSTDRNN